MPELSKLIAFVSAAITVFVQGEAGGEGTEERSVDFLALYYFLIQLSINYVISQFRDFRRCSQE